MAFLIAGAVIWLVALSCFGLVLAHAFRQSVGSGLMVLLIPCFVFYYAFAHFQHPRKGLIVAALMAASVLGTVFLAAA